MADDIHQGQIQTTQGTQSAVSSTNQPPVSPPVINIPALHYLFSGNFVVTFSFGAQSTNEETKKKFQEMFI